MITNQDVLDWVRGSLAEGRNFSISSGTLSDSGALWVAGEANCHCAYRHQLGTYRFSVEPFFCSHVLDKILR
jgi:hypothetical protein